MRLRTLFISAGLLAAVGAAAVYAQGGPRHFGRGGHDQLDPGAGMDGTDMRGMRGWFGRGLTKDDFDTRTRERFARLDRNSDGAIDAAEIEAAHNERMGAWGQRSGMDGTRMGERLIRLFDTNKDGKVGKDEYQAGIRRLFAEMDLNNDGRISDEDLPPMLRGRNILAETAGGGLGMRGRGGHGGAMGLPMLRLLAGADANKDGVITLDEALAAGDKRFAFYDRNKDGVIDKADFGALRKEMVDYRVKRFIHHFGADKDGRVTREQFNAKAQERFAQMDLNGDGTISRDEMPGRGRWHRGGGAGPMHGGPDHGGPDGDMPRRGPRGDGGPGPGPGPNPGR